LNVLNRDELEPAPALDFKVFPWLGKTRISDKGQTTFPQDVHPLQAYWGMPRRIRLTAKVKDSICDLCNRHADLLYREFRTKNYGMNYGGAWLHPLTPYRFDPKKNDSPLSVKGQQGGLGYSHWLGLALQDSQIGERAAHIVKLYNEERAKKLSEKGAASLWCFGYDMDNMKARCWYDTQFPVFYLSSKQRINLVQWAGAIIHSAEEAVTMLRRAIKAARFRRPEEVKGDTSQIDAEFWQATEADFYRILDQLTVLAEDTRDIPSEIKASWYQSLKQQLFRQFNAATLTSNPEELDLKRIVIARNSLSINLKRNKAINALKPNLEEPA
jgi:CRISPR system Cascade subunit CasA